MNSTSNRIIKNTGFLYIKMGITMFISLYTTRLILNSLGASDYGIFNIVGGAIAMLGFLNAAMASATQRFMSYAEGEGDKNKQKCIFNVSFILHIIISILVGVALLITGYFFFNGVLNISQDRIFAAQVVYGSLIVSTMFTVMTVPYEAVMNAHENMLYYAIIGIVESLLKLGVAYICVVTIHDKLIVYGILMACIPLITLTIMRFYCHKHYSECIIAPKIYFNKKLVKEMTSFAGWSFCSSSTNMIGNYGLGIVLNMFFKTTLNAAQGIAGQITGQLIVFSSNMIKALNPVIYKTAGSRNNELSKQLALTGCKFSFLITAFFTLPFIIEAPYILKIWLKNVPDYTVIFTRLQILRTMIEQLTISLSVSISATGNIKRSTITATFLNLLPLPLTYYFFSLGAPPYSMYLISIFIWSLMGGYFRVYYAKKYCSINVKQYINEVLFPCCLLVFITLLFGYIIVSIFDIGIIRVFITIILSCIIYITFVYKICLNKSEKNIIYSFINKIKGKV